MQRIHQTPVRAFQLRRNRQRHKGEERQQILMVEAHAAAVRQELLHLRQQRFRRLVAHQSRQRQGDEGQHLAVFRGAEPALHVPERVGRQGHIGVIAAVDRQVVAVVAVGQGGGAGDAVHARQQADAVLVPAVAVEHRHF